jgi:hypothetical protein
MLRFRVKGPSLLTLPTTKLILPYFVRSNSRFHPFQWRENHNLDSQFQVLT